MFAVLTIIGTAGPTPPALAQENHEDMAEVTLNRVSSTVPDPDGSVRAVGTIENVSDVELHEVQASFWIDSNPLKSRSEIAAAAKEVPGERLATRITEPYDLIDQVEPIIEPGESARFELDVPVEYLDLSAPGTYIVGADVRATIPPVGNRDTVGRVRTFLPLVPDAATAAPVELTVMVPLTADPAFLDGSTILDAAAARAFGPDGRLRKLLELGAQYDVTWLVDPALLERAEVLASGSHLADGSAPVGEAAAKYAGEWLTLVEETLTEANTLWLPYADPDLSAVQHRGLVDYYDLAVSAAQISATNHGQSGLLPEPVADPDDTDGNTDGSAGGGTVEPPDDAGTETNELPAGTDDPDLGPEETPTTAPEDEPQEDDAPSEPEPPTDEPAEEEAEPTGPSAVYGLPGAGYADANTLDRMAAAGAGGAILSRGSLPDLPNDGTAPVASVSTPSGAINVLVTDRGLTAGGPPGDRESVLARQRLLAETASVATAGASEVSADGTLTPRRLVTTLPRDWAPNRAGAELLDTISTTPWLTMVPASVPLADPPMAYGGKIRYPDGARDAELPADSLTALESYSAAALDHLSMLAEPEDEELRVARDFLRGSSIAWRDNSGRGVALLRAAQSRFAETKNNVDMLTPRFVTLSSRSGSFPITIANENDFPVRVTVRVTSRSADRLDVAPLDPITIPPNRRETERPLVEVLGGGVLQVDVGLATPAGTTFGDRHGFAVRATDYGLVGWGVLGVGGGLLALALVLRIVRRGRPETKTTGTKK